MTVAVSAGGTSATVAPRTAVRPPSMGDAPGAGSATATAPGAPIRPAVRPRRVPSAPAEDRIVVLGSLASAASLAWVLCFRLLPWGTTVGFAVTAFVSYLAIVTVATLLTVPGPLVADRIASAFVVGGFVLVAVALATTVVYTFVRGAPAVVHLTMFTQDMAVTGPRDPLDRGGLLHAIVGSLIEIGLAVVVTVPLALGTAVFMTEVGGRLARVVRTVVDAMTALPSVVAGLFIYAVLIAALGLPRSGLAAATALAVMMLPIVARAADVVLRVVPSGLREAGLALGASRWRTVWHVVLPTARPALATALILGVARGVGETSPVLLTSGAAQFVVTNPVGGPMNSLPLFIYSTVRTGEPLYVERGFAAASVLLGLVLVLFVAARLAARQRRGR